MLVLIQLKDDLDNKHSLYHLLIQVDKILSLLTWCECHLL